MFTINDIIYTYHSWGHQFAIVEKFTPTGKLRIRYLQKATKDDPANYSDSSSSKTRVVPDITKKSDGFGLIQADGSFTERGHKKKYEKYNDNEKIYDVWYDR